MLPTAQPRPQCALLTVSSQLPERSFSTCEQLPGGNSCGFYAVYDGHGGYVRNAMPPLRRLEFAWGPPFRQVPAPSPFLRLWLAASQRAASFASEKMQNFLTRSAAYKGKDLVKALKQAFHDCETEFIQIAGREGLRDGTTAVVALVQDDTLTVAHVGDSRGVLCRANGVSYALTEDHKPELEAEKKRIEALGGFVSYLGCWRAMGILAMSRALGDLFLKPYVSAEPGTRAAPPTPTRHRRACRVCAGGGARLGICRPATDAHARGP